MTQDRPDNPPDSERRDKNERRTEDRRAHDRYTPMDGTRIDRRQSGERRREGS
jgi:hypothetical protein